MGRGTTTGVEIKTEDRAILFVLGMARSGTAALTRVVSLCGGTLPAGMLGANRSNPRGYWEPRAAVIMNKAILRSLGRTGIDPSLRLQEAPIDAEAEAACIGKIRGYLTTLPAAPLVVIKDPQITVLSEMWFEAARQSEFKVMTVIAVRHPEEVTASMARFLRASPEFSGALWLKYNLLSERTTRGLPRVFVEYSNFLDDWRRETKRISAALEIDLDTRDERAIDTFLERDFHHHQHRGPITEQFGTEWFSTVYEELSAASRGEPADESALDRVFDAYRAGEHGFREVVDDFHRFRKFSRLTPPSIEKLAIEVLATAHRHRGTWA
ncbi:sulfotransferase family protein [Mycobacterium sp. NPDC051804]|uniref:sulfotransferase family protein n=1 Tax=Mycobacterium sp. NPDC051804 TaxID=3364295 RepID=UPI0037B8940F